MVRVVIPRRVLRAGPCHLRILGIRPSRRRTGNMLGTLLGRSGKGANRPSGRSLGVEQLEARCLLSITPVLNGGILTVTADPTAANNNIRILLDPATNQLVVRSFATDVA